MATRRKYPRPPAQCIPCDGQLRPRRSDGPLARLHQNGGGHGGGMGETLQVVSPRVLRDKRHHILSAPLPDGRRHHDLAIRGPGIATS
jgi:hypothetical protein